MDRRRPRAPGPGRVSGRLSRPAACPWSPGPRCGPDPRWGCAPDWSGPPRPACAARPWPAPVDQREVQRSVHRRVSAQYQRRSGQALPPSDTISRAGNLVPHNQQDCTAGFARETLERSSPAMFGPPPGSIGRLPGNWTVKQPAPRAADSTTVPEVWHADGPPSTHSAGSGQPKFSRGAFAPGCGWPPARGGAAMRSLTRSWLAARSAARSLWVVARQRPCSVAGSERCW